MIVTFSRVVDTSLWCGSEDIELARAAAPEYEVELEFCGQKLFQAGLADRLAQSMFQKVQDLVRRVMSDGGPPSASNPAAR